MAEGSAGWIQRLYASVHPALRLLAQAGIACVPVLVLYWTGVLARLELPLHDAALRFLERPGSAPDRESDVLAVGIPEEDIRRFGHPLPDALLAEAVDRALAGGARVVGIDIFRDLPVGHGREDLASLARADAPVIFAERIADVNAPGVPAPDFTQHDGQCGFGDVVIDPDGLVRRHLLALWDMDGELHLSFALHVALRWLAAGEDPVWLEPDGPASDPRRPLRLGQGRIERLRSGDGGFGNFDDRGYQVLGNMRAGGADLDRTTLSALLDGSLDPARLEDRAVLIGTTAASVGDRFRDAMDPARPIPGVILHATFVERLLRTARGDARTMTPLAAPYGGFLAFAIALAGAALGGRILSRRRALAAAVLAIGLLGLLSFGAMALGIWLPAVAATLSFSLATAVGGAERLVQERSERQIVDDLLLRHVSGPVRDVLWQHRDEFLENGRLRARHATVTVLFADMVGFAEVAETQSADTVLGWLSEVTGSLSECVEQHGGIVDDYWGDGLKANFGALLRRSGVDDVMADATAAARCALAVDDILDTLNARQRDPGGPPVRMRVGIHTGPVVVGSLGGLRRHKLTTVGDTPNVAARLEAIPLQDIAAPDTDALRWVRILVSEESLAAFGGAFLTEDLGERTLRGRRGKIRVHRLLGSASHRWTGPETLRRGDGSGGPE